MANCSHGDGVTVSIGGVPVDPCVYEDVFVNKNATINVGDGKIYRNVTVIISKCIHCGHEDWSWIRQENTEEEIINGYNDE